jgi:general secretion pathway protein I
MHTAMTGIDRAGPAAVGTPVPVPIGATALGVALPAPRLPAHPRGVTLIELVVAVAILALGAAAAWQTLDTVRRSIGGQANRALAQEVALTRAAELRLAGAGPGALPGQVRMGGIDWSVAVTTRATAGGLAETEVLVTAPGRRGSRLLVWLPVATGTAAP